MIQKNTKRGEFHIHTTSSDGVLTIEEVLTYITGKLDYFCITDHDIIDSSLKAAVLAPKYGLKSIIGVEVSSYHNEESIHILGYFKNSLDLINQLKPLDDTLKSIRENRIKRMYIIKELLLEHFNIDLNVENLLKKNTITRGSIAREIIAQGYKYTNQELFDNVIGKGCKAYYPATKISTLEAINLIHECHGLAVLAHPCLIKNSDVNDFIKMGIDGIEAIYPKNKEGQEEKYKKVAKENDLFITAGNDFHAFNDGTHGNLLELGLYDKELKIFIDKINKLK